MTFCLYNSLRIKHWILFNYLINNQSQNIKLLFSNLFTKKTPEKTSEEFFLVHY